MNLDEIITAATVEVTERHAALTRQYLTHNQIRHLGGRPVVAHVEYRGPKSAIVYFPLEGQRFYLGVVVEQLVDILATFVFMEADSRVCLVVGNEDEAWTELPFSPTHTLEDGFEYQLLDDEPGEVSRKIARTVAALHPHRAQVARLAARDCTYLQVSYYGYAHDLRNLHLPVQVLQQLTDLNLNLQMILRAGGGALPREA